MTNRWMAMVLLTLTSCGDGIVGSPYRGDSLYSFEGIILTFLDEIPDEETTRVALGWSETSEATFDLETLRLQNSVSTSVRFPSILRSTFLSTGVSLIRDPRVRLGACLRAYLQRRK